MKVIWDCMKKLQSSECVVLGAVSFSGLRPNPSLISKMCHKMFEESQKWSGFTKKHWKNIQPVVFIIKKNVLIFFNLFCKVFFGKSILNYKLLKYTYEKKLWPIWNDLIYEMVLFPSFDSTSFWKIIFKISLFEPRMKLGIKQFCWFPKYHNILFWTSILYKL